MEKLVVNKNDMLLIVAPHPDDESIGCGGLILRNKAICTSIYVMTDGGNGSRKLSYSEEKKVRKKQFTDAMAYAGINNYFFINKRDGELLFQGNCVDQIDFTKYTKIFLPFEADKHPDHVATFFYSLLKIKTTCCLSIDVYMYEVNTPMQNISHYIDITDDIDEKIRLISFHMDQVKRHCYADEIRALNKFRACQANYPHGYFEGYMKLNLDNHLINLDKVYMERKIAKYKHYYSLLYKWTSILTDSNSKKFFDRFNWRRVSVLGPNSLSKLLEKQLKKENIEVVNMLENTDFVSGINTDVDILIIISLNIEDKELKQIGYKNTITFEELINEL